jgi:hypothetical protein
MADQNEEPMGLLSLIDDETYKTCSCTGPIRVRLVEGKPWLGYCECGCPWMIPKQRPVLT